MTILREIAEALEQMKREIDEEQGHHRLGDVYLEWGATFTAKL